MKTSTLESLYVFLIQIASLSRHWTYLVRCLPYVVFIPVVIYQQRKMKLKINIAVIFMGISILTCSSMALATPKTAICQIDEGGRQLYKGKCQFEAQGGGSFYISHPSFVQKVGVEGLMVLVERKNQAVVQATRIGGGGSVWGEATRSQSQKACWIGSDFKICAW